MPPDNPTPEPHKRRPRYKGTHPRRFDEKYKELDPARFPEMQPHVRAQGRTPAGTHVPVLLNEVLDSLKPGPGSVVVDCTLGYGGHALELARRIRPGGTLIGLDVDGDQLARTRARLERALRAEEVTGPLTLHFFRTNFAGLPQILSKANIPGADAILADLGVSSMQIDDPARGFSYKHDSPLDMRMDQRIPRTAADWLQTLSQTELVTVLRDYADEPYAEPIAAEIVRRRAVRPLSTTRELVELVASAKSATVAPRSLGLTRTERRGGSPARDFHVPSWPRSKAESSTNSALRISDEIDQRTLHPAARVFQALRIKVNDELGALAQFLRILPTCLNPGGRAAIITFHSGEDRLVKKFLETGREQGTFAAITDSPISPASTELRDNPRAASAKLRWALRA